VEWIGPECREFIVGFEKGGLIDIYRAESNNMRPSRTIQLPEIEFPFNSLQLSFFNRPRGHYTLIICFSRDMNLKELEKQADNKKSQEDSIINGEQTEIIIRKGFLDFDEVIRVD